MYLCKKYFPVIRDCQGNWLVKSYALCNQWHTRSLYCQSYRSYSSQNLSSVKAICHLSHIFLTAQESSLQFFSGLKFLKVLIICIYIYLYVFLNLISYSLALLPPVNRWVRPRNPPPPPPTNTAEAKSQKSPPSPSISRISEQLQKSKEVKNTEKPSCFYENAEFHRKLSAGLSISTPLQQTTPRKSGTVNVAMFG